MSIFTSLIGGVTKDFYKNEKNIDNNIRARVGRELGYSRSIAEDAILIDAIADPKAYLTKKLRAKEELLTKVIDTYILNFAKAIEVYRYNEEKARAFAKKAAEHEKSILMEDHKKMFPDLVNKKIGDLVNRKVKNDL